VDGKYEMIETVQTVAFCISLIWGSFIVIGLVLYKKWLYL